MGRNGKMHGSPFHVESAQYKYAVEHEFDNYAIQSAPIKCVNRSKGSKHCNLWNIEYSSCTPYRCRYYSADLRRANICLDCAYYYKATIPNSMKRCFHPKRPIRSRFNKNEARYCCYFYGSDSGKKYFYLIRNFCKRIVLTELVEKYRKKIRSKTLYVSRAKKELCGSKISEDDKAYLKANIKRKAAECSKAQKMLERSLAELSAIGGELKSIPAQFSTIKK